MSDLEPLIGILSGDLPPAERRRALRGAALGADDLKSLVDAAWAKRTQDPEAARRIARGALAAGRTAELPEVIAFASRTLAQTQIVLGNPRAALRLLRRHGRDARPEDDAGATLELAQSLSMLGMRPEAEHAIAECRERMPSEGAAYPQALLDLAEASLLHRAGHVERALSMLDRARPGIAEYGSRSTVASVDANRASVLSSLGRYGEAEALYREAGEALVEVGQHGAARYANFGHAQALMRSGRFHESLRAFVDLRAGLDASGENRNIVAGCLMLEAEVNLALNLPSQAWHSALEARTMFEDLGMTEEQAQADFVTALAARGLGRTVESLHRLEAAYRIFSRPGGCTSHAAMCLYRLAEADQAVHETGRGAVRAERAHDALRALGWHERAGRAAVLQAELETEVGELDSARARLMQLLDGERACRTPWVLAEAHHKMALVEELRGDRRPAARHVLRATRVLERYRATVPPDEYMAAFLTGRASLFEDAIRIVTRLGGRRAAARAFELSEQARARALLDMMRTRRLRDHTIEREVERLGQRIQGEFTGLPDDAEGAHEQVEARRIAAVSDGEARLRRCLDQLALEDPDRARELRGAPVLLESLVDRLPDDETLIEFFLAKHELFVFVVDRSGLRVHRKPIEGDALRRLMSRMRFHLDREQAADDRAARQSADDVLEDLNTFLLGDIRETLTTTRIVIVPHGQLHGVPFSALSSKGRPFIEEHEVVVAPSAAIYLHCLSRTRSGAGVVLLGLADERAPNAVSEVRHLAELMPEARLFTDELATSAVLEREGRSARVVHLAAHTEYRHDDPMQSRIRLADGWLTIPRLYELDFTPELLVLSGCATGRVAVTQGGDLFGLVRGFLHAGVPALLTSLWEVSDERTLEYMERFYAAFAETGGGAPAAHRRAALEIRAERPHPYYWAPFVLTGR